MTKYVTRYLKVILFLIITTSGMSLKLSAQESDCMRSFREAMDLYQRGEIETVLSTLDGCLTDKDQLKKASKEIQAEIYWLAAHANIILNRPQKAKEYIMEMLAFRPYYRDEYIREDDLLRFRLAVDTLYALPRLMAGFKGGTNLTMVNLIGINPVLYGDSNVPGTYSSSVGYQFGLALEYVLYKNWALAFEPTYTAQSYGYDINYLDEELEYKSSQKMAFIELPLLAKYYLFVRSKYRPYIQAGGFYKYLMNATKSGEFLNSTLQTSRVRNFSNDIVMNNSGYGFIAGLGMNFNLKRLGINVDIRYKQALNNINDKDNRFINNSFNEVFVYGFYDALDDIKLREVELSVGIIYHLNYKAFKQ